MRQRGIFFGVLILLCNLPGSGFAQIETRLSVPDAERFGRSVDISGDYAVVGARGAAYVFKQEDWGWEEQAKLVLPIESVKQAFFCKLVRSLKLFF